MEHYLLGKINEAYMFYEYTGCFVIAYHGR